MSRKGIPNREYDECEIESSRCKKCGSTERSAYRPMHETHINRTPSGKPATHAVWRACHCLKCGQHRRDVFYENRLIEKKPIIKSGIDDTTKEIKNLDHDVLF
jgi:hypothetical protein